VFETETVEQAGIALDEFVMVRDLEVSSFDATAVHPEGPKLVAGRNASRCRKIGRAVAHTRNFAAATQRVAGATLEELR